MRNIVKFQFLRICLHHRQKPSSIQETTITYYSNYTLQNHPWCCQGLPPSYLPLVESAKVTQLFLRSFFVLSPNILSSVFFSCILLLFIISISIFPPLNSQFFSSLSVNLSIYLFLSFSFSPPLFVPLFLKISI